MRNEVHVCTAPNGHHLSTDCWCEPTYMSWVTNKHGVKVFIVEHCDETLKHRILVVSERERDKSAPYSDDPRQSGNQRLDSAWITRGLSDLFPPQLPPHQDPNERNL